MPVPLEFLNAVGVSALPVLAGGALAAAEVGSSVLGKVWEWWSKRAREAERRRELEALAGMSAQQVKEAVRDLAAQIAADHPPAVRSKLEGYLMAVPAQIRRTLRRPSDAAGLTVPPDLVLTRPEDLAPLLPPRPPRFSPGDHAPGTDFELIELLGIGGFGEVWKARNAFMPGSAAVALKFCLDPAAAASLRRETALLDRIQREGTHPGIVQLRHTFLSSDPPFLEYELVEGGDLGGLILDWHRQKGGPSPVQAARVVRRLAEVVAFAHAKGIVHRDLKPANILLAGVGSQDSGFREGGRTPSGPAPNPESRAPNPLRLKVADFGIGGIASEAAARQALLTRATGTLTAAAAHGSYSLYYASPEQMRGSPPDPRDDVHALGVVWYQLLAGDLTAEAPRGAGWKKRLAAKGMAADLIDLLESCVASERADRPADAREIADRLAFALAEPDPGIELDLSADKPPDLAPAGPPSGSRPGLAPAAPQTPKPLSSLGRVAAEAQEQARWEGLLTGLREIRSAQNRTRWAGDWWVRLLARVAALAVAALAGVIAGAITGSAVTDINRTVAQEAVDHNSPRSNRISMNVYRNHVSFSPSTQVYQWGWPDPRSYTRGRATITVAPGTGKDADEVNDALKQCADEYTRNSIPWDRDLVIGWSVGGGFALVLLPLVGWLRGRKLRALARTVDATAAALKAEFPREVADLAEHADLHKPTVVRHLIRAVEEERKLPPEPVGVGTLFHRVFAPF